MKFFCKIFWSFAALVFFSQPLLAQGVPPVSEAPGFSTTQGFSTTSETGETTPAYSTTPTTEGTAPSPLTPHASPAFSATSSEKATLAPLEEFKFKPAEWSRWSVGLLVGVYRPSLDTLNRILSDSGTGILQDPNFLLPGNPDFPTSKRNIVTPHIFGLTQYGVEAQLDLNPKYSFTFAFGSWQGESRAEDSVTIFTRSNQPPSIVPRDARYHVTINQFWWGLRYHILNEPGRKKLYLNIGLLGISGAYLTMDSLERVITNNNLSFDSVSVTEASGYGFTTRFGAGGEVHLQKWLSIGVNVNYIIGKIDELKVTRYFASGFAEPPATPPDSLPPDPNVPIPAAVNPPAPGDVITYAQMTTLGGTADRIGPQQNLSIDLDGFEISFYIQFHF